MGRIIRRASATATVSAAAPAVGEPTQRPTVGQVDTPRIMLPDSFRADVSCRLLEVDFAGIEAITTGYQLKWINAQHSKDYIRLARLGIHAALTARVIGRPADLTWPDDKLGAYLGQIKEEYGDSPGKEYDTAKRTIHGSNFGLTPFGAAEQFPKFFPTLQHAQKFFKFYYELSPSLPTYHFDVRKQAKDLSYLGGPTLPGQPISRWDHPYGYKHWFWDVLGYQPTDEVTAQKWLKHPERKHRIVRLHGRWFKVVLGGDSKRVIAFYPQSIAAGVLKRAELRLFHPDSPDYIGDAYFGRTPLLHPIHDSLFLHVPNTVFDRVVRIVVRVMQDEIPELPIPREWGWGNYLRIGVDAKAGRSWDKKSMAKVKIDPLIMGIDNPEDDPVLPREDSDGEDWSSLERQVA